MAPSSPDLITTVTEDIAGTKGWSTIVEQHTATGFLVSRVTTMDNGSTNSEMFEGLQRVSQTITDTDANSANWASRTVEWNWAGAKTERTTIYDDGSRLVEAYDTTTGNRISRTDHDDADVSKWQSTTTFYDATTQARIGSQKVHDNGRIDAFTFDAATGATATRTLTDGGNVRAWHTKEITFDLATGKQASRTITYDDNASLAITWNDGIRASRTRTDGDADTFEWHTRTTLYDVNGKTAQVNQMQDDGDLIVSSYAANKLLDVTTYDNSGNEAWHIERVFYDPAGDVSHTAYYDDSGNVLLI